MGESLAMIAGIRFKQLIKNNKLTQEKAANLLSVDEKTIRRWIKNGIDRLSTLEFIAEKFEIDVVDYFLR